MTIQDNINTQDDKSITASTSEVAWTIAKIIDELKDDLARAHVYVVNREFGHTKIVAKYYEKVQYYMYRIPLHRPTPHFDIELSDLRLSVKRQLIELRKIDPPTFQFVRKMAVSAIFENVSFEYFHRSVMRHLRVRFIS